MFKYLLALLLLVPSVVPAQNATITRKQTYNLCILSAERSGATSNLNGSAIRAACNCSVQMVAYAKTKDPRSDFIAGEEDRGLIAAAVNFCASKMNEDPMNFMLMFATLDA